MPNPSQLAQASVAAAMQTVEVPESALMADPMHDLVDPSGILVSELFLLRWVPQAGFCSLNQARLDANLRLGSRYV